MVGSNLTLFLWGGELSAGSMISLLLLSLQGKLLWPSAAKTR